MANKWLLVAPVAGALGVGAGIGVNNLFAAGEAKQELKPAVSLPLTRVVLFNSGVGYFSRSGDIEGEVVVQSFTPFHPAIQYARRHDFGGFYEQEIEFREQLKYPPLTRVALLTLKGRNEDKVKLSADHLRRELEKGLAEVKDLVIAGPAPAPLARAESNYRHQIMLRARQMTTISRNTLASSSSPTRPMVYASRQRRR